MKTMSSILSALLVVNAVMMGAMGASNGLLSHVSWQSMSIGVGLPLCLAGAGILQWIRPSAALLVLALAIFPFFCVVVHANILPIWPLLRILPRDLTYPALFLGNAGAVVISLAVWLGQRKGSHNIAVHGRLASSPP
jgi:hypothetical protein